MIQTKNIETLLLIKYYYFSQVFNESFCFGYGWIYLNRVQLIKYHKSICLTENCTVDYVIFETAGTLKDALVREWNTLSSEDVQSLQQYLLQYVMNKPSLPVFVRERILQVNLDFSTQFEVKCYTNIRRVPELYYNLK